MGIDAMDNYQKLDIGDFFEFMDTLQENSFREGMNSSASLESLNRGSSETDFTEYPDNKTQMASDTMTRYQEDTKKGIGKPQIWKQNPHQVAGSIYKDPSEPLDIMKDFTEIDYNLLFDSLISPGIERDHKKNRLRKACSNSNADFCYADGEYRIEQPETNGDEKGEDFADGFSFGEAGKIYRYPDDDQRCIEIGDLKLSPRSYTRPQDTSRAVDKSIKEELELYTKYIEKSKVKNPRKRTKMFDNTKIKKNKRSRMEWKPLSVFTIYTSAKSDRIEETDFLENIPYTSCFGRINFRMKRAWSRGPNKIKASEN